MNTHSSNNKSRRYFLREKFVIYDYVEVPVHVNLYIFLSVNFFRVFSENIFSFFVRRN